MKAKPNYLNIAVEFIYKEQKECPKKNEQCFN